MLGDRNGDLYGENMRGMDEMGEVWKCKGISLYLVMGGVDGSYLEVMNEEEVSLIEKGIREVRNKWENVDSVEYFGESGLNKEDL